VKTVFVLAALLLTGSVLAFNLSIGCQSTVNTYAPWYCNNINMAVYEAWLPWIPLATAAILLSFTLAALIIMIGIAMKNEKVKNFGVGEIYEALATTIIVLAFMYLAGTVIGIIPSYYVGNINPYNSSLNYINNAIIDSQNLYTGMFQVYIKDSYYANSYLSVEILSQSENPTISTGIFTDSINLFILLPEESLGEILSGVMLILHMEFYLLVFAMEASIPVFLIPGIIMRAILPTRGIGGMFIGTAIGLFVIMPLLFSVAYYFTNQGVLTQMNAATAQINQYGAGNGAQTNAEGAASPLSQAVQGLNSSISSFWIATIFFPALIIAVTVASILTIADFIGGMAHKSGKLIFGL
jgi:hypothetical protein